MRPKIEMTMGQKIRLYTDGQFGDPSDEELRPFAVEMIKAIGATSMKVEDVLNMADLADLREALINEFFADQDAKRVQREADAKAKIEAEAAANAAQAKAEIERVRQAFFALKRVSPEEQKKFAATAWAKALANGESVEFPTARQHEGNDTCGMPDSIGCCGHTEAVSMWSLSPSGNSLYGVCSYMDQIYEELYELSDKKAKIFLRSANKAKLEEKATHRKEREVPVRVFVRKMSEAYDNELPFTPEPKLDKDGQHLCAMGGEGKIPCCDGNQSATRFFNWKGRIYGGCRNYANAALAELKRQPKSKKDQAWFVNRIKSTDTLEEANKVVESYLENQQKKDELEKMAKSYAFLDSAVSTPEPHGDLDGYGNIVVHRCSAGKAGWGCCDGTQVAERGSTFKNVVRGFCRRSAKAMFNVYKEMKKANENGSVQQAPNHIRTDEIANAIKWVKECNDRNDKGNGDGKSPLGNTTDPDSDAEGERRLKRVRDRSAADYENRPEPNVGSGPLDQQRHGNGKGKNGR